MDSEPLKSLIISETIEFPIDNDLSPSQIARVLHQLSNIGNALIAGICRHACQGDGPGAATDTVQKIFSGTAQFEVAALQIEQAMKQVLVPSMVPPGGQRGPTSMGRA